MAERQCTSKRTRFGVKPGSLKSSRGVSRAVRSSFGLSLGDGIDGQGLGCRDFFAGSNPAITTSFLMW
jgi:hypothetical protein